MEATEVAASPGSLGAKGLTKGLLEKGSRRCHDVRRLRKEAASGRQLPRPCPSTLDERSPASPKNPPLEEDHAKPRR